MCWYRFTCVDIGLSLGGGLGGGGLGGGGLKLGATAASTLPAPNIGLGGLSAPTASIAPGTGIGFGLTSTTKTAAPGGFGLPNLGATRYEYSVTHCLYCTILVVHLQ